MSGSRYPVKRDISDLLSHPDTGLTEQERQAEIADRGAASFVPYAIQVKRWSSGDLAVPTATQTAIPYDGVYFENKGGLGFPPDGHAAPPDASHSMWTDADLLVLWAPVAGLYGFHCNYAYTDMAADTYFWTRVDHINSTVAIATHSLDNAGKIAYCEIEGTTRMDVGDWIKVWAYQESGATKHIKASGGFKDDEPTSGPVFSMWLIAPEA